MTSSIESGGAYSGTETTILADPTVLRSKIDELMTDGPAGIGRFLARVVRHHDPIDFELAKILFRGDGRGIEVLCEIAASGEPLPIHLETDSSSETDQIRLRQETTKRVSDCSPDELDLVRQLLDIIESQRTGGDNG